MQNNRFSVVVPVFNKSETLARCLQSLISQTYDNFEVIIIDVGSTDGTKEVIKSFLRDRRFRAYFMPDNAGRIVARNIGMRMARTDWICWLDADDEYFTNYFDVLNEAIQRNPKYNIFNFGMFVKDREIIGDKRVENGWRIVEPLQLGETENGHVSFDKGQIGTGSFIFKKKLLSKVGYFPEGAVTPDGGSHSLPARWVLNDPAMAEICKQNEKGSWLPLGNPWGDDYSFFWRLTRENKTKTLNVILYIQHVRK